MRNTIAIITLVAALGIVNWSIAAKERHLSEGTIVYLELAPVDPRSLMQGDYMALRFRLANELRGKATADGYAVVKVDDQHVGQFDRLDDGQPLAASEVRMRYRLRNGAIKFATNAFFFQEGYAEYYEPARYGQFRVDEKGDLLLAAMYDENLVKLGPPQK